MINIPDDIKKIIQDKSFEINKVGLSDSQVLCFDDMVLKIERQSEEADNEAVIMKWLKDKIPVPEILGFKKSDNTNFLLMTKVSGEMSFSSQLMSNPNKLVKIMADGLKTLWNIDILECPYNSSIDNKLKIAEIRVVNKLCDIGNVEPETYGEDGFSGPEELLKWLKENKPQEDLVFSHGDYCMPNIFIKDDKISGFIDLGRAGIADKYQDIALCYRSLLHNYDGRYGGEVYRDFNADILFEELGIEPDWNKIKYYILLDELF